VWRPSNLPTDFAYLGDVIKPSHSERPHSLVAVKDDEHLLACPTDYEVLWYDGGAYNPGPTRVALCSPSHLRFACELGATFQGRATDAARVSFGGDIQATRWAGTR